MNPAERSRALEELHALRASWWGLRRAGAPLPAEPGVIWFAGGRR